LKYKNKYINEKKQLNMQGGGTGDINDFIVLNFNVTQFEKNNSEIIGLIKGTATSLSDVTKISGDKLVDTFKYVALLGADKYINDIGTHILSLNSDCIKIPQEAVELAKIKTGKEGYGGHVLASLFINNLLNTKNTNSDINKIHFGNPMEKNEIETILIEIKKTATLTKAAILTKAVEKVDVPPDNIVDKYYDIYLSIITNNFDYLKTSMEKFINDLPIDIKMNFLYLSIAFGCDDEARLLVKYILADVNYINYTNAHRDEFNIISNELKKIKISSPFCYGGHILLITYVSDLLNRKTNYNLIPDKLKIL